MVATRLGQRHAWDMVGASTLKVTIGAQFGTVTTLTVEFFSARRIFRCLNFKDLYFGV